MARNDKGLTPGQEAFATGLASGLTQAEAYRRAYPKAQRWKDETVWKRASELAANGAVSGRVQDLLSKAAKANEVTVERVLTEIVRMGLFDPADLIGVKRPEDIADLPEDVRRAIVGWSWDKQGRFTIKMAKEGSVELLARHLGMLKDRLVHSTPVGAPLQVVGMTPAQFAQLAANIASKV